MLGPARLCPFLGSSRGPADPVGGLAAGAGHRYVGVSGSVVLGRPDSGRAGTTDRDAPVRPAEEPDDSLPTGYADEFPTADCRQSYLLADYAD